MQRPLGIFFKLVGLSKVATLASGEKTGSYHYYIAKLLYVADKRNKCKYLIDTDAAVSILPKSCANRTTDTTNLPLDAANNTTITTYNTSKRIVDVGLKREYAWTFIIADIKQPIIGADFLIHYSLLADLKSRCLRDMQNRFSYTSYPIIHKTYITLNRIDTIRNENTELLDQFPELTRPTTKGETVKHGITHNILTKGHPVFARPRRLAPDKLVTAKREFDEMIKLGVIKPSDFTQRLASLGLLPNSGRTC